MDRFVIKTIMNCCRCKGFRSPPLHCLPEPIARRHQFNELMVAESVDAKREMGDHETQAVDGHLCAAGVGYEVAVGSDWKNLTEEIWRHL